MVTGIGTVLWHKQQHAIIMLYILDKNLWFPPVEESHYDGLLAIGGDLSIDRLLLAYRSGIFPWFSEKDPPLWWSPDPRFVLHPKDLKISKSMKQVLKSGKFEFRVNTAFEQVIRNCKEKERKDQGGTWISDKIVKSYLQLHQMGYAHSAETWQDDKLVGGLYGVLMGKIFFGESMFAHATNASKFSFISLIDILIKHGVNLIDCQVHTAHLESLGATMMDRREFIRILEEMHQLKVPGLKLQL